MKPLPFDDPRWQTYKGGYRVIYDASIPLGKLINEGASDEIWKELWNELHHQGDVGSASYAAVPWLVMFLRKSSRLGWNALSLIATIELERPSNPEVPLELNEAYFEAIQELPELICQHPDSDWDELTTRAALTCIALARGQRWIAKVCFEFDRDEAASWYREEFGQELEDI